MIVNGYAIAPRVDLSGANLSWANLSGANLSEATLRGANLRWTDLSAATLRRANLRWANLSAATLSWANLSGANLSGATLSEANLRGANLSGANLSGATLRWADLLGATLHGATLSGANLSGAINVPNLPETIIVPEGDLIVYKKVSNGVAKLLIPQLAKRSNASTRKCRAEYAKVLECPEGAVSNHDPSFKYEIGKTVRCHEWDSNRWNECSGGIHFFLTRQEAENY